MIDFSNTKELIVFILFAVLSVAFTVCGVNVSRKNVEVESGRVICTFALCTLVPILFFAVICAINLFEPFGLGIITQGKECSLLRGDNVLFTVPFGGGFIKIVCTRPIIKFFIMETLLMIVIILFAVPIRRTSSAIVAGHDGDGYIMVGSSSSLRLQPEVDYSSQSYVSGQIYVSDEHLPNIRRTEPLPPSTSENSELPIFAASQPIDELEAAYYREYFSDVYDHIPYYQTSLSSLSETNENDDKKFDDMFKD